jgi:hypothetical protein
MLRFAAAKIDWSDVLLVGMLTVQIATWTSVGLHTKPIGAIEHSAYD